MSFFSPLNPTLWASLLASPLSVDGGIMQMIFVDAEQKASIMKHPEKIAYTLGSQAIIGIPIGMFMDSYLGVTGNSLQSAIITFAAVYAFQVLTKAVTGRSLNKLMDVLVYYS